MKANLTKVLNWAKKNETTLGFVTFDADMTEVFMDKAKWEFTEKSLLIWELPEGNDPVDNNPIFINLAHLISVTEI